MEFQKYDVKEKKKEKKERKNEQTKTNKVAKIVKKIIEHEIDSIPIVEKSVQSDNTKVSLKILGKISKTNITKLFVNLGEAN